MLEQMYDVCVGRQAVFGIAGSAVGSWQLAV